MKDLIDYIKEKQNYSNIEIFINNEIVMCKFTKFCIDGKGNYLWDMTIPVFFDLNKEEFDMKEVFKRLNESEELIGIGMSDFEIVEVLPNYDNKVCEFLNNNNGQCNLIKNRCVSGLGKEKQCIYRINKLDEINKN